MELLVKGRVPRDTMSAVSRQCFSGWAVDVDNHRRGYPMRVLTTDAQDGAEKG